MYSRPDSGSYDDADNDDGEDSNDNDSFRCSPKGNSVAGWYRFFAEWSIMIETILGSLTLLKVGT